ncbi:MAG: hypothetical protein J5523_05440 [Muribaculaceae bacterium]|nr:hypothetical protein [Muribaculaceae bacterium]
MQRKEELDMLSKGYYRVIMLLLALQCSVCALADDFDVISERLALQRFNFPQEKLHITTDKSRYMAGDTIWLRAFVVNAATHEPVDASKYCYVELINPFDSVELRIKVKEKDGVIQGYLALPPQLPEGSYTLAGYTLFMQSLDEGYFFKKRIEVMSAHSTRSSIVCDVERDPKSPGRVRVTAHYLDLHTRAEKEFKLMTYVTSDQFKRQHSQGKSPMTFSLNEKETLGGAVLVRFDGFSKFVPLPPDENQAEVRFFPEGGYLVPDARNHVSVKAIYADGSEASATGRVLDSYGNEVATFTTGHAGIGDFYFEPQAGMVYRAVCRLHGVDKEREFELPQVKSNATIVQVDTGADGQIHIRPVGAKTAQCLIIVQQRGVLLATGTDSITLPGESLSAGVIQALLLDERMRPLSERLFYVPGTKTRGVKVACDKNAYASRDRVVVTTSLEGFAAPLGNYAVSVTDDKSVIAESASAIEVNLLLQSDLRGHLPDLAYYFAQERRESELDAMLMTHGWRRYNIPDVLRGQLAEPSFPIEQGLSVTGTVVSEWKKTPIKGGSVQVLVPKLGYGNTFATNDEGEFVIEGFELPDSALLVLQAYNSKGGQEMNVALNLEQRPAITSAAMKHENRVVRNVVNTFKDTDLGDFLEAEAKRMQYIDGLRNIVLGEVEVTALAKDEPKDVFQQLAARSFDEEYMEESQITSIEDAVRRIAGIRITGGRVKSARTGGNVGFFLDGVYVEPMKYALGNGSGVFIIRQKHELDLADVSEVKSIEDEMEKSGTVNNALVLQELDQQVPFQSIKRIDYIQPQMAVALGHRGTDGGAIMITTKDGVNKYRFKDMNPYLKTYIMHGIQSPAEFFSPDYDLGDNGKALNTDLRNTLYWNPCVQVGSDGKSRFSFFAADVPNTTYTITIEGITADGSIIATTHKVKKQ